jgi:hypothetical protein
MIQHHYVEQLERDLEAMTKDRDGLKAALLAQVTALRSIAAAMAEEMEQHGGEQAFDSLARYRAARAKEAKP